jgi:hypothetical protein
MENGFKRRDREYIKMVFNKYSVPNKKSIDKDRIFDALSELDSFIDPKTSSDQIIYNLDKNSDGDIDLNEFTRAVQSPRPLENLVRSLPLHQLLVDCLPRRDDAACLRGVSMLSKHDIDDAVQVFGSGLTRILHDFAQQAQRIVSVMDQKASNHNGREVKFQMDVPPWSWGSIKDFHRGLASRIGARADPEPMTRRTYDGARIRQSGGGLPHEAARAVLARRCRTPFGIAGQRGLAVLKIEPELSHLCSHVDLTPFVHRPPPSEIRRGDEDRALHRARIHAGIHDQELRHHHLPVQGVEYSAWNDGMPSRGYGT